MVAGGYQHAVHDQHGVRAALAGPEREQGPEAADDAVGDDFEIPNGGVGCRGVWFVRE